MSATITASVGGVTLPLLVTGYDTARQSRNIVHDLLSDDIAVILVPARPRSGTLELLYDDETNARGALDLHGQASTFDLVSDERESVNMTYVVDGEVRLTLEDETRSLWLLAVGYQEVIL